MGVGRTGRWPGASKELRDNALENIGVAQSMGELELDENDLSGLASFCAA